MKVLHKHAIYLDKVRSQIYIDVMQGDANTRVLEFSLYEGGSEWPVPAGASVAVAYRRADGRKGIYDTLADGSVAYTVAGNVVTVTLVPQALAVPGNTAATVVFTDTSGGQLATFCVILRVERNPAIGAVEPEDYYNLKQMIAAEVESLLDGVSVTGGGSAYYFNVNYSGDNYVSDKNFSELVAAYNKGRALYCVLNNNLVLALVNKNSGNMVFQSINDRRYFRVTITSEDTVIAATDDYALLTEVPDKLPNPNALTINGKTYDGSDPVNITISGGDASENILIGQTPFELTENSNVKLVGEGTHTYTVKGKTVADLSTMTVTSTNATLTEHEDHIEIVAGEAANWYGAYVTLTVKGLTVGKTYVCVIDQLGLDTANLINNGYYMVKNSSGTELARMGDDTTGLNSVEFTPDTSDITIVCYPCNNYYWGENYRTARIGDLYINEAADGTQRTDVINKSGTFTDSFVLGQVSAGVTITTEPSCEVYSIIAGNSAAALPLTGKTVVCFGDSLFGMHRGDTSAPAFIAQKTGATVHNVGFGGCRMSTHPTNGYAAFSMWALAKAIAQNDWTEQDAQAENGSSYFAEQLALLKSIDFSKVDMVVIHYGTNDFTAGGTGVAIDNAEKPQDVNTLCGAMRYSITALLMKYPHLRIFVSVPAFRYWTAEDGTITYSDTYTNGSGNKLTDFVDAIANTAREYNLPVIDSYYGLGINEINGATFLADGVHHNEAGRKRFGEFIGDCLTSPDSYGAKNKTVDNDSTCVKSVNGNTPDANGNVNVSVTAPDGTVLVDPTLTQGGVAADAAVVGQNFKGLTEELHDDVMVPYDWTQYTQQNVGAYTANTVYVPNNAVVAHDGRAYKVSFKGHGSSNGDSFRTGEMVTLFHFRPTNGTYTEIGRYKFPSLERQTHEFDLDVEVKAGDLFGINSVVGKAAVNLKNKEYTVVYGDDAISFTQEELDASSNLYRALLFAVSVEATRDTAGKHQLAAEDGSMSVLRKSDIKTTLGKNLFNPAIFGEAVIKSDGTLATGGAKMTFIKVEPNTAYSYNRRTVNNWYPATNEYPVVAYYDENLAFLSAEQEDALPFTPEMGKCIVTPDNCAYVAVQVKPYNEDDASDVMQFERGTHNTDYEPYGKYVSEIKGVPVYRDAPKSQMEYDVPAHLVVMGDSIATDTALGQWYGFMTKKYSFKSARNIARGGWHWTHSADTQYDISDGSAPNNVLANQVNILIDGVTNQGWTKPDVVLVYCGINDRSHAVDGATGLNYGDPETAFEYTDDYSNLSYGDEKLQNLCGAFRFAMENLYRAFPYVKVVVCTPMYTGNNSNKKVRALNKTIKECASWMGIPVFDLGYESYVYQKFEENGVSEKYLGDALHPNEKGGKLLADLIAHHLIARFGGKEFYDLNATE